MRSTISQTLLGLAVLLCLISFVSATYTDSPVVTRRKVLRKRAGGKCSAATTKTTSTVNGSPTSTTAPVLSATEGTGSDDGATTSTLPNNNQHVVITTSKPASSTSTSAATSTSTSTTTLGSGSGSGYVSGWTEGNGPFSGQGTWYNTMGGYGACGSILSDTIPVSQQVFSPSLFSYFFSLRSLHLKRKGTSLIDQTHPPISSSAVRRRFHNDV